MMYYHQDRRVLLRFEFQVIHSKKQALTTNHNATIVDGQVFVSLVQLLKLAIYSHLSNKRGAHAYRF